jgi:uncharacterized protein YndB with AHSA1/START domain
MPDPVTASIEIAAEPERVFEFFTRSELMLRWMGEHAQLEPAPGGAFSVDIRGVPVRGRYLAVEPPHRLVVSWGHAGSERLPPGASTLEVRLSRRGTGTLVEIVHRDLPEPEATRHQAGWRRFLRQLATAATPDRAAASGP